MSAPEEPTTVDPPTESPAAPVETDAPADDEPKSKPASSSAKKAPNSRPKGRPSAAGASKKAATTTDENRKYDVGDIVLARLRGYPPWPARIADPDTLPRNVLKQKPGKNPHIYCCQFFPAGDFSWLPSKEIKPLSQADITAYTSETHRKAAGGLMEAYQTAQDPTEWDSQQTELHKKRDAADAEAEEGVDELEDEEEQTSGGKRKRSAAEKKDKKKKAKTAAKSKAAIESETETSKSKAKAPPKSKGAKPPVSKAENQEAADDDPLASNPECVKVKDWRHKLQRAFLGKSLPTAEEMPSYHDIFKTIENYENMSIEALQYSKIGKVMKKIMGLSGIPRNDEFKITERADKLMHQWATFIQGDSEKPNGEASAAAGLNGDGDVEDKKAPAAEAEETKEDTANKETEAAIEADKADGEKMEVEA